MNYGEVVYDGPVGAEGLLISPRELVLLYEMAAVGRGTLLEQVGESGAGVAFGDMAVSMELGECFVVGLDGFVRGLEWEEAHGLLMPMYVI